MNRQDGPPKKTQSVFSGVLLALIVFFIVIPLGGVMTCMVCAKMRADRATVTARVAEPQVPTSTAPEMNAPGAVTYPPGEEAREPVAVTISHALFTKDRLIGCIDQAIVLPAGVKATPEAIERLREKQQRGGPGKGWSLLSKSCKEQFHTKPELARCITISTGHGVVQDSGLDLTTYEAQSVARYYDLDVLTKNDAEMKGCIDMQGDWQAVDKDSDEYREAVRARARREVEHLQEQLGK
jgi:hypothetical protein